MRQGLLQAARRLGAQNLLALGGIFALVGNEFLARKLQERERKRFEQRYRILRQRQQRLLESTLKIVCELVEKTLGITCNARYFQALKDKDGKVYLVQDRDLAVLNINMPREYGFTRIAVDTPHIVSGRSYLQRTPLYEELPIDHSKLYATDVAQMIEPSQRWVLACPVLRLDPLTNRHDHARPPHGVIVFYGVELPAASEAEARIGISLRHAQQFADHMTHVLNMLEVTEGSGGVD